jgi:predicted metalloprotease
MRWQGRRASENVEDRRGTGRPVAVGGGLMTLAILLLLVFLGMDPIQALRLAPQIAPPAAPQPRAGQQAPPNDELKQFVSVVLADTEDIWSQLFTEAFGRRYAPPKLVLFSGRVSSACGLASAAVGPFYCPLDRQVYIDLSFYEELKRRFGAPGDFAQAYVIAHEIGHHVQNLLGVSNEVQTQRQRLPEVEANRLSVRLELQADFLAGVWAHHVARFADVLEEDDIREAVRAAAAIGDDAIQKQSQGYVVPDAFTHGSSDQRVKWFLAGFTSGDPRQMDDLFTVAQP